MRRGSRNGRRVVVGVVSVVVGALVGALLRGDGAFAQDAQPDGARTIRSAVTGGAARLVAGPDGKDVVVTADGRRFPSHAAWVTAEQRGIPASLRRFDRRLWPAVQRPDDIATPLAVTIVLREQPVHDVAERAKPRLWADVEALAAPARAALERIGPAIEEVRRARGDELDFDGLRELELSLLTPDEVAAIEGANRAVLERVRRFRLEVFAAAAERVAESQAALIEYLSRTPGTRVLATSVVLNTVTVELPAHVLAALTARFEEIDRISPLGTATAALDKSVGAVGASAFTGAGYAGSGVQVAVVDTGMDASHPALSGQISASGVFLSTAYSYSSSNGWYDNQNSTDDYHGHGTHVGGIVGSTDSTYGGIAQSCDLINVKAGFNLTSGSSSMYWSDAFQGVDWAVGTYGADAINFSFGGSGDDGSSTIAEFYDAVVYDLLVHVATSSGNDGPSSGTVGTPADAYNVITVGNFDDNGTTSPSDDSLASSSSRGPTSDGRRKPELSAPGTSIASCRHDWEGSNPDFVNKTGTSMASPHVAGALALLLDYSSSWLSWPEATRALLMNSVRNSSPYPSAPDNNFGTGGMNLSTAYAQRAYVKRNADLDSTTDYVLYSGSLSAGDRLTLCWSRHVLSNGTSAPTTVRSLTDLDLRVYSPNGPLLGSSISGVNSYEQVKLSSSVSDAVIKVLRYGSLPSGVTSEYFALATPSGISNAVRQPPDLAIAITSPDVSAVSVPFDLTATVSNSGGVAAAAPELTLTLPAGYALASGSAVATVGYVPASGAQSHTWSVVATEPAGPATLTVDVESESFDETFTASGSHVHTSDAVAPRDCTLSIDGGATYATSRIVSLTSSATDDSGVARMRVANDGQAYGVWSVYDSPRTWQLTSGDGAKTVTVQFQDGAGNHDAQSTATDSIVLDTEGPVGSVAVESDADYARQTVVALDLDAHDDGSGVAEYRVRTDGAAWTPWAPYATTHTVSLPSGSGRKWVYAQFRDFVGHESATAQDDILLDESPPFLTVHLDRDAVAAVDDVVELDVAAGDQWSGIARMRWRVAEAAWNPWATFSRYTDLELDATEGLLTIEAQVEDGAGNLSEVASDDIWFDWTAPTGSFVVDGGAPAVGRSDVTLTSTVSDAASGVTEMRFRNGDLGWSTWRPYSATTPWTLDAGDGVKTVRAQYRDAAGNESAEHAELVHVDTRAPTGAIELPEGDRGYVLGSRPWKIDVNVADEAAGSGLARYRVRFGTGDAWSEWRDLTAGGVIELPATERTGTLEVGVEVQDLAGNTSETLTALTYRLPGALPAIEGKTSKLAGVVNAPVEVAAYAVTLLAGEDLRAAAAKRSSVDFDVIAPDGTRIVTGSLPPSTKGGPVKGKIKKLLAPASGTYTFVVRPNSAALRGPVSFQCKVKLARAGKGWRYREKIEPEGQTEHQIAFEGADGFVVSGTLSKRYVPAGDAVLVGPDETVIDVPLVAGRKGVSFGPVTLGQGAGQYRLVLPVAAEAQKKVTVSVDVRRPSPPSD